MGKTQPFVMAQIQSSNDQASCSFSNESSTSFNPKSIFRMRFEMQLPSRSEAVELASEILDMSVDDVSSHAEELGIEDAFAVDENAFSALFLYCWKEDIESNEISFLKALIKSPCSRCRKWLPAFFFLSKEQKTVLLICMICRKQATSSLNSAPLYSKVMYHRPDAMKMMLAWHRMNIQAAATLESGYYCLYMSSTWANEVTLDSIPATVEHIKTNFEKEEMFDYVRQSSKTNAFHFYCSQRSRSGGARGVKLQEQSGFDSALKISSQNCDDVSACKRFKRSKRSESCFGSMNIKICDENVIHVRLSHAKVHEKVVQRYTLSEEEISLIADKTEEGLAPFQICELLRCKTNQPVSWNQVYYRWLLYMEKKCRRHANPFLSCKLLMQSSKNLKECYFNREPYALGFTTSIAKMVTENHECGEAFIDSTFKTNSSKLELFTIMVSVFGTGFPIAYMFLDGQKQETVTEHHFLTRQEQISNFFAAVQSTLPRFSPKFFLTDKDHGQMNAIRGMGLQPSLCLWHMKRSIKKKIQLERKSGITIQTADETKLLSLMTTHFNMHPHIVPFSDVKSIHVFAVGQIRDFCSQLSLPSLYGYLWTHWYEYTKFLTWGRRNEESGIPLFKTTMMVESHWSLIKRHYFVLYNRPRVDFVAHVMDKRLVEKYWKDYELRRSGVSLPSWFLDYTAEWRKLKSTPINRTYPISQEKWICGCPAFLTSRFLICKHLVQNSDWIEYRDLVRSRHPPFISSARTKDRHYALCGECIDQSKLAQTAAKTVDSRENLGDPDILPVPGADDSSLQCIESGDIAKKLKDDVQWMTEHIESLEKTEAGSSQLKHIEQNVWKRVTEYRENVMKNQRKRSYPRTWPDADTVCLP